MNKSNNNKKQIIITVILIILFSAAAFFGGTLYSQKTSRASRFGNQSANSPRMRNFGGGRSLGGEITKVDAGSITLKDQSGKERVVFVTDQTNLRKADTFAKTDLKAGLKVMVIGDTATDGSLNALNLEVVPELSQFNFNNLRPTFGSSR